MRHFDKLVRDRIPEIIKERGDRPITRVIENMDELLLYLHKKLHEEVSEYFQSEDTAELADVLEVVYKLAETHGCLPHELDEMREQKAKKRGAFQNNILLISTENKKNI